MTPTAEQVLLEIRHACAYQRARFPNTYPAINRAAERLVASKAFADFVTATLGEMFPTTAEPPTGAEVIDLMAALKASLSAAEPKK